MMTRKFRECTAHGWLLPAISAAVLLLAACVTNRDVPSPTSTPESSPTSQPTATVPATTAPATRAEPAPVLISGDRHPAHMTDPNVAAFGETVSLPTGEMVILDVPGTGEVWVTFREVIEDARCPIGALCIVSDRALIGMTTVIPTGPNAGLYERRIETGRPETSTFELAPGVNVTGVRLHPRRTGSQPIMQSDYVVSFTVGSTGRFPGAWLGPPSNASTVILGGSGESIYTTVLTCTASTSGAECPTPAPEDPLWVTILPAVEPPPAWRDAPEAWAARQTQRAQAIWQNDPSLLPVCVGADLNTERFDTGPVPHWQDVESCRIGTKIGPPVYLKSDAECSYGC